MKKKILIIGGGITGCVCAILLKKAGHEVTIYDARKNLGGILNDITHKGNLFFRGVQYFDIKNLWFKEIYKLCKKDLKIFDHSYGSYTEFNNNIIATNDYAIPVVKKILIKKNNQKLKNTLTDRFNYYSPSIRNFMSRLVKKFNLNPSKLFFESSQSLQLLRVASKDNEDDVLRYKQKSKIYDDIYAIKRSRINSLYLKASLPKNSFNNFFLNLYAKLKHHGIKIELQKKINPIWEKNNLKIFHKGKEIISDFIFWTGNPTELIKNYNTKKLDSLSTRILIINADLKNNLQETKYIQVFSIKTKIIKIYMYNINDKYKISIECIYQKNINKEKILKDAINILKQFKIKLSIEKSSINSTIDIRYNIVSKNDYKTISQFLKMTSNSNLISGSWLKYSRDERIELSVLNLKKNNLI
jgi:UDP-galactopyranose mutase